ncbi:unnamed protein product, partial [marine sediment metagenome]
MTILSGILSLQDDYSPPAAMIEYIKENLSRNSSDDILEYSNNKLYLAKIDIGAFSESGIIEDEESVVFLTGEPLLEDSKSTNYSRLEDCKKIKSALSNNNYEILKHARGVFSFVFYNKKRNQLILATDKLGIRPLYYVITKE